jgi:rubrerythrin
MSDCIDRELLKSKIRAAFPSLADRCRINEIVNSIPAADVKPVVHGKWESHGEGFKWVYICSVCGFVDGHPMNDRMNYCPACGADMRRTSRNEQGHQ